MTELRDTQVLEGDLLASAAGGGTLTAVSMVDELGDEVLAPAPEHGALTLSLDGGGSLAIEASGLFRMTGNIASDAGQTELFTAFVTDDEGHDLVVTVLVNGDTVWSETVPAHSEVMDFDDPFAALSALSALGLEEQGDILAAVYDSLGVAPGDSCPVHAENVGEGVRVTIDPGDHPAASVLLPDLLVDDLASTLPTTGDSTA